MSKVCELPGLDAWEPVCSHSELSGRMPLCGAQADVRGPLDDVSPVNGIHPVVPQMGWQGCKLIYTKGSHVFFLHIFILFVMNPCRR